MPRQQYRDFLPTLKEGIVFIGKLKFTLREPSTMQENHPIENIIFLIFFLDLHA
jgi:hypothetical protein